MEREANTPRAIDGDAVDVFNRLSGRLRVSVTHACQLRCRFCHREGIEDHWQSIHMPVATFERIVAAFEQMRGQEINVTGGDPLVHPNAREILKATGAFSGRVCLCTNGLNLPLVADELARGYVDEIKLSVHASEDTVGRELLGNKWSGVAVRRGLAIAKEVGTPVTMNFSLTGTNRREFEAVVELALAFDTNLLVIDLIGTRWNLSQRGLGAVDTNELLDVIARHATPAGMTHDRTGCRMRMFETTTGRRWAVKDVRNGLLFTGMCNGCQVRHRCGEGVFVLRVDAHGILRPCLLRADLAIATDFEHLTVDGWMEALRAELQVMMEPPHQVSAGVSLAGD